MDKNKSMAVIKKYCNSDVSLTRAFVNIHSAIEAMSDYVKNMPEEKQRELKKLIEERSK